MLNRLLSRIEQLKARYLSKGSIGARFVRGAFWALAGSVISRGLNFLSYVIIARIVGKVEYGEFGIIQSTVGMFAVFAGLGLGLTSTKYISEYREIDKDKAGRIIGLSSTAAIVSGAIMSVLLVVFAPALASQSLKAPHLTPLLRLGGGLLFLGAINGAQNGVLAGFEAYKKLAWINAASGIISFPLILAGVWFLGIKGAILGLIASLAVHNILNRIYILRECVRTKINIDVVRCHREIGILWKFSVPAFLSSAMVGPITWLANTIIIRQINGYSEIAVFVASNQVRFLILYIPAMAFQALLPILSSEVNKPGQDRPHFKLHILNAYSTWYLATSITALFLFFSKPILGLFGKGFVSGNLVLVTILCTIPIVTYKDGIARLIQAKSLMWYGFFSNLLWGIILIVMTYMLAKNGALGLGIAYVAAYLLNSIIVVPFYFKKLEMGRIVKVDLQMGALLSLALIPGILVQVLPMSSFIKAVLVSGVLVLLTFIGRKLFFLLTR